MRRVTLPLHPLLFPFQRQGASVRQIESCAVTNSKNWASKCMAGWNAVSSMISNAFRSFKIDASRLLVESEKCHMLCHLPWHLFASLNEIWKKTVQIVQRRQSRSAMLPLLAFHRASCGGQMTETRSFAAAHLSYQLTEPTFSIDPLAYVRTNLCEPVKVTSSWREDRRWC